MATMTALATVTVGAGGASSISFTNIPQTYTDLYLVLSARTDATIGDPYYNSYLLTNAFPLGGGAPTRYILGNGSSVSSASDSNNILLLGITSSGATTSTFGNISAYYPNYASTTQQKSVSIDQVSENNSTTSAAMLSAGLYPANDAITSITIDPFSTGNFVQYSTATLYGVWAGPETFPSVPTIGTATATGATTATVAFTPTSATGVDASYTALSSPGSITATGTSSPITVSGLTTGTAYTFQVRANNPGGSSAYSSASNSVTPILPTSYESIATINVGSGGAVNATFTSIPQTYTHLQLRVMGKSSYSGTGIVNGAIQLNGDTSGSNYSCHNLYGDGSVAGAQGQANYNGMSWYFPTSGENGWAIAIFDILDYTNTNKYKTIRGLTGVDNNGSGRISFTSSNWRNTAAVTSITLPSEPLWVQYSTFCLYGIKGS